MAVGKSHALVLLLLAGFPGIKGLRMNIDTPGQILGRVASLHVHPGEPGLPLRTVDSIEVVAHQGILGEPRYFGRTNQGRPSPRQLSLIEREQIAEHAVALGLEAIPPGAARANIETQGMVLLPFVGRHLEIGEAVLFVYQARTPCAKMDAICTGLRALMQQGRQGVVAQIVSSGHIRVNDPIRLLETPPPSQEASVP
jgi:MOSC domain-containing protein YiiM